MLISPEKKGQYYRRAADAVTYSRTYVGTLAAINILSGDRLLPKPVRHRSIGLAAGVAALGVMDRVDGILARRAERYGVEITDDDKIKDPIEDKKFNRRMMGAIAAREVISGAWNRKPSRVLFGALIGINLRYTEDRDARMNESRRNAVQGADVGAIKINKYKTGVQNLGHALASSPLANTQIGQSLIGTVYTTSTVMGEVGFRIADRIHKGEGLIAHQLAEVVDMDSAREAVQFGPEQPSSSTNV